MTPPSAQPVIGVIANEPSGDQLGASLIRALRERLPGASFVGVAGPQMKAAGCETLVEQERLSVMGLMEVLAHLRELLAIRSRLERYFVQHPPDVLIGIDAPDFNLGLERRLRCRGLKTVHFVSPTVWAWRAGRVKGIRRAVDLLLSIFPFEEAFLRRHDVPATYVGHPLADEIPFSVDREAARRALGLPVDQPVLALLPGSRLSEVQRLAGPFVLAAERCRRARPDLVFAVPCASPRLREVVRECLGRLAPGLPVALFDARSREVLAAADIALTASGTATLEALLLKRPMVVAYRVHPVSYHLVKQLRLVKVPYVAMANLLVGRELAPELIQERCRPDLLARAVLDFFESPERVGAIQAEYARVHHELRRGAAARAAAAVIDLMNRPASGISC